MFTISELEPVGTTTLQYLLKFTYSYSTNREPNYAKRSSDPWAMSRNQIRILALKKLTMSPQLQCKILNYTLDSIFQSKC